MKLFKQLFISLLVAASVFSLQAASVTMTIPTTGFSNVITGPAKVTQVVIGSAVGSSALLSLIDAPTNQLAYTNAAYIQVSTYATNVINTWTNYYGRTNSLTNVAIVDVTNTVSAATVLYPVRIIGAAPTNGTIIYDNVNYYFTSGLQITNKGAGTATITVTYQQ